jgi:hypothetical protein
MAIQARYSGVCPECEERWQPGDLIRADEDRQWKHAEKAAGRELDGRTHDAMPGVAPC